MVFDVKCKKNVEVSVQPKEAYLKFAWDDLMDAENSSVSTFSITFIKRKSNSSLTTGPNIAR